jgi:uncharacterized lipoprotein YehR (DUF1307 family)
MKKFTKVLALVVVASMLCLILASCGALSGKYRDALGLTTYEFKGNKVTLTISLLGAKESFEGTYKINKDGDEQEIEFTFGDKDAKDYSGTFEFEKTDDGIKIGLFEYEKVK